ncbi:ABC transporter ATP-binding protein (plasmid) [Azospirillum baldaniorum]|uniref:ABC multidrug transport system, fused ATPase and permease domain n=1 Tax=Azospirillum baldaniorum TaxID=1064539 RepID=A0A9P1NRS8_9PROT|nr:ABC transporter ATP-binding protein [Azospirillum baldaniorum]AWJ93246.1 ABC transporter ATP-binding protein [Azospirillum baldaniorum]TWA77941.1 ATP-binding cassette subfamily B protein [Azospirillum brasilense]CCD02961.1 putative ABC multidrug transport system, fused ATPase and permease domain [Azospirillum baldaniorum]
MAVLKRTGRTDAIRAVLAFTFRHWSRRKPLVAWIAGTIALATLADVFMPLFAGRLVDALALLPDDRETARDAAVGAFAAMVGLGAGMVVLRHIAWSGVIPLTLRIMADVGQDSFHRVQRFSTDWHANSFAGSIVRKITRGMWALDTLNDTLLLALWPSLVVLAGTMLLLGLQWPVMGLVIALGTAIYIALTVLFATLYIAPAARLSNAWDTRLGGTLADAIGCNAVVKAFGAEPREDERLAQVVGKWSRRTSRTWTRHTRHSTAQLVILLLIRSGVVATALWLWWRGQATPGDVAYVLTTYFVVHGYLRDIGMHINHLQRSINEMEELVAIHAEPLGVEDRPDAVPLRITAGEVRFDRVTFRYGGHTTPLYRDLSVTIRAGERVGLVGPSGSGKTTFVKLIQRLYDVTGGCVRIDGQDVAGATQTSLRSQIAIVPQEPILFHRSLAENIAYGRPGATPAEIERAARLANAHDFIARLPKGYATLVGERGVKLSGGERQRVALARAFLADAPLLILDEATSSLDSESEALIQEAMERLMQGRTALVIAHRLSTVRSLDRILVFHQGRVVEEGTHAALLHRPSGLYRRLFEQQSAPESNRRVSG